MMVDLLKNNVAVNCNYQTNCNNLLPSINLQNSFRAISPCCDDFLSFLLPIKVTPGPCVPIKCNRITTPMFMINHHNFTVMVCMKDISL